MRHPDTIILNGEFVPGLDKKMRYFKPIRIEMYSYIKDLLKSWHSNLGLYMCMESDEIWQESFGWSPKNSEGLSTFLDNQVIMFFN